MPESAEFPLRNGLTTSMLSAERQPIGFSIAGEHLEMDEADRRTVELVCAFTVGCAIVLLVGARTSEIHMSPRQRDVLRWAAEGLTVDLIADRLTISVHTADTHLRAVRERLGAANTAQAVAEAFRLGLIS